MAECTLCGKDTVLYSAQVEGAIVKVCEACLRFGKRVDVPVAQKKRPVYHTREPEETLLVENYGKLIIEGRRRMGLERKDFAMKIGEKEILIRKIEGQELRPEDRVVRKIECFLGIKLTVKYEPVKPEGKAKGGELTLGDIVEL